jgi:hypothetical protein
MAKDQTPEQGSDSPFRAALHITFDERMQMGVQIENLSPIHLLAIAGWVQWHAHSLLDQAAMQGLTRSIEIAQGVPAGLKRQ